MPPPWTFEHSIICAVPKDFAWRFWSNVDTWLLDADIEAVQLDGDFVPGAKGVTISRSSGPIEWRLVRVTPGTAATIEIPMPGALATFDWDFEDIGAAGTRITQRVRLDGDPTLTAAISPGMELGIPAGMLALCERMKATSDL